jgi:hypothetical protein
MSVTTNQPRGMNLPRPKPPIVPVTQEDVRDWWALFVNRKAYTRQSANPHPETGRHYHYQPKNKDSGQPLELDPATVHKHVAGWITAGLYVINPQSQRCKWIAIDADYDDTFFDLGKLKGELELDGVSAALEMSRRGGHLWIFCEQPLLAEQCGSKSFIDYDLLITRHTLVAEKGMPKPKLETKILFFHRFGVLERELWGKDKMFRGAVAPQFFMSNGSEARVLHFYQQAVFRMTEAVTCTKCKHQHLREPPSLEVSVPDLESVKVSAAVA